MTSGECQNGTRLLPCYAHSLSSAPLHHYHHHLCCALPTAAGAARALSPADRRLLQLRQLRHHLHFEMPAEERLSSLHAVNKSNERHVANEKKNPCRPVRTVFLQQVDEPKEGQERRAELPQHVYTRGSPTSCFGTYSAPISRKPVLVVDPVGNLDRLRPGVEGHRVPPERRSRLRNRRRHTGSGSRGRQAEWEKVETEKPPPAVSPCFL